MMAGRTITNLARLSVLAAMLACAAPAPVFAKEQPVKAASTPLDQRTNQLVLVLKGVTPLEDYFAPSFLQAIPAEQFKKLSSDLIASYGQPLRVLSVDKSGPNSATLQVAYEKGTGTFLIYINPAKPNKVTGLLAKGFALAGDSIEKIEADFAALPGSAGFGVYQLGADGATKPLAQQKADTPYAIGSTFKLYILAELASEVVAGQRKWTDVTPLAHRSFSSSATNNWPVNSPATLHSLATWMISLSDNSATDTLLFLLGRSAVEEKLAMIGHSSPDKTLPFLSTVEAFALKSPANKDVRDRFLKASEAKQRDLLTTEAGKLAFDKIDPSTFSTGPMFIDTVEWFATPGDIARVFDNIRRTGSQDALDILTVNKALPQGIAEKWKYVGYKGGSEPGVISLSYLLQAPSGKWIVVSGSWNDKDKTVDEAKFAGLMARLVDRMAE